VPSTSYPHTGPQSSDLTAATSAIVQSVYSGTHPDGRLRVSLNDARALVSGVLYAIGEKRRADGTTKKTRSFICSTPGYQAGSADEISFLAVGRKTSKPYRIVGYVEYCRPRSVLTPQSAHGVTTVTAMHAATASDPTTSDQGQRQHSKNTRADIVDHTSNTNFENQMHAARRQQPRAERREKALQREQAAVAAQRVLGLDPLISIAYLSHISGRSVTTLYREFGKVLPMPIKVGSRSRISYSAAEAYMAGRSTRAADVGAGEAATAATDGTVEGASSMVHSGFDLRSTAL
jgi:hypothetical protein